MNMELIQSAASDALVNVVLAVIALAGAFAEAVDATTDAGLLKLAARAGLTEADVRTALADEGWRAVAEANRAEMFDAGLWGVPSFRVGDRPAQWGQDRLWAVEADLAAIAGASR